MCLTFYNSFIFIPILMQNTQRKYFKPVWFEQMHQGIN